MKNRPTLSRREFLKKAAAAGAGFAIPAIVPSSVFGKTAPSNRITMGCIGVGGMGMSNLISFLSHSDVQIVAVCDVEKGSNEYGSYYWGRDLGREPACEKVEKHYAEEKRSGSYKGCAKYEDFRELLARDDIDAVMIATPDHWHIPIAIAAAKAGKDIYCEKPLSLTIREGRILSDTVKRYGRVFQTGSQQRSDWRYRLACELVRNGRIGKIHTIRCGLTKGAALENQKAMPIPAGFNYDMWLGQAPWAPYTQLRCHYNFRYIRDYAGGQLTNMGAHELDIIQWALGTELSGPVEVKGQGEIPKDGLYNVPVTFEVEYTYDNGVKVIADHSGSYILFEGTEGSVYINRSRIETNPANLVDSVIKPDEIHLYESNNHHQNFLDCVKNRRKPIAHAEIGHRSAAVCHLGNIAVLLQRKLKWDPAREQFINDDFANRMLSRPMRNGWHL